MILDTRAEQERIEVEGAGMLRGLEESALADLLSIKQAGQLKTQEDFTSAVSRHIHRMEKRTADFAQYAVNALWNHGDKLITKYHDGQVTTREGEGGQEMPGYPAWYLRQTEFAQFPADKILPLEVRGGYQPLVTETKDQPVVNLPSGKADTDTARPSSNADSVAQHGEYTTSMDTGSSSPSSVTRDLTFGPFFK